MPRCHSWTPVPGYEGETEWPPKPSSKGWRICLNPVGEGETRCPDCASRLATHKDPRIRQALMNEPNLSTSTLQILLADPDPNISQTAAKRLGNTTSW